MGASAIGSVADGLVLFFGWLRRMSETGWEEDTKNFEVGDCLFSPSSARYFIDFLINMNAAVVTAAKRIAVPIFSIMLS